MRKSSVGLIICAIIAASVFSGGCMGERSSNETQVQMKITKGSPGAISSAIIEPSQHPVVSVVVTVSAPDIDPPLVFTFPASEVAANFGVVQMQVPTGLARTFDVTVMEVLPPAFDQFPGKVYAPTSTAADRTFNLSGTPLLMNLNVTQVPTGTLVGTLYDTRTGTRMALSMCDPEVDMVFKVGALVDPAGPVTAGLVSGIYSINNVPLDMPINISVADPKTGAIATADVVVPSSAGSLTQNMDLVGASPLALTPSSASVLPGQTVALTQTGGLQPVSTYLSPNNSGGTLVKTGPNTYLYTAGPAGATQDQVYASDYCNDYLPGAGLSTINVNYLPSNNIWRVDWAAPGGGNGLLWGTAFNTITAAMAVATAGDEIWVKGGIYPRQPTDPAVMTMKDGVKVFGGFLGTELTLADRTDPPSTVSTLNGGSSTCHVVIGNSNAVLDHFRIVSGFSYGAIPYCTNPGGAGIYNYNVTGTVFNSLYVGNNYLYSPGAPTSVGSGIKNRNSNISLINCQVVNNSGGIAGGGIYNLNSPIQLIGTTVQGNSSTSGGGIFNKFSNMTVSSTTISNNQAGAMRGGGMYNYGSTVTISNSDVWNNAAANGGGGGIFNFNGSNLTLSNVSVYTNTTNAMGGGGISNTVGSTLNITNSYFSGNTTNTWNGGAVYSANSSFNIANSNFFSNHSYYFGGAVYDANSTAPVSISDSSFSSNYCNGTFSTNLGGAIMTVNSQLTISNSVFTVNRLQNYAPANKLGGALYVGGNGLTVTNVIDSTFDSNQNTSGKGGAIAVGMYGALNLSNTKLNYNIADRGGALYTGLETTTTLENSTFKGNSASNNSYGGGAIFSTSSVANHSTMVIFNNVFQNNDSSGYGGAILNWNDSSPTIINNTFYNNYSYQGGGAMYNRGNSYPIIMNSILWNDSANEIENEIGSSAAVTYSDLTEVYPGAGNIAMDPLFLDVNYGDLHLSAGSPAINMGNPDPAYNDPDGTRNDMGAFGGPNTKHFDRDYDGMEDWWEIGYGLNINDPADAGQDPDGDGITNLEEFRGGTNPWVPDFIIIG